MCSNNEKIWVEKIELVKELEVTDTIRYGLNNATLLKNKRDVILTLKENDIDELYSNDSYLLNHLDTISGSFALEAKGFFRSKPDT